MVYYQYVHEHKIFYCQELNYDAVSADPPNQENLSGIDDTQVEPSSEEEPVLRRSTRV